MVQSRDQSLVKKDATTFGGGDGGLYYVRYVCGRKPGIDGLCSRANHCNSGTECSLDDWNQRVTAVCGDPQFHYGDQRAHDCDPEANKEKYSGTGANDLWIDREKAVPEANEQDGG
jgi:hypothetical protein